jgi:hypothetical protein
MPNKLCQVRVHRPLLDVSNIAHIILLYGFRRFARNDSLPRAYCS